MAKVIKLKTTKRFGPRYGRRTKERLAEVEKEHKKKQKCPYCSCLGVKRLASGIWLCTKCKSKFTGRAYSIKKTEIKEETSKEDKKDQKKGA